MLEPMISKAARHLGVDQVEIRKINAPVTGSEFGPPPPPAAAGAAAAAAAATGARAGCARRTSGRCAASGTGTGTGNVEQDRQAAGQVPGSAACRSRCASGRAAPFVLHQLPPARSARSGRAAVQVGRAQKAERSAPWDRRSRASVSASAPIPPARLQWTDCCSSGNDGKVYVHSGIGNLGTGSVMDCSRIVAEELEVPWEQIETVWGNTSKHLAWSSPQAGSQTIHAHTRANLAATQDLKKQAAGDRGPRARRSSRRATPWRTAGSDG